MGKVKTKKTAKKSSKAVKGAKQVVSAIAGKIGKTRGTGRRSRKKGATWYAKEILRLRLKKKYEKIKYAIR